MAGYWGKMERIVCSYQPVPGSQIVWWGRIINNEQSETRRARLGKGRGGGGKNRLI